MSINLGVRWSHPAASSIRARYARIDNTTVPVWSTASPNPIVSPAIIAQNVDNGQWAIELTPVYNDGRDCTPEVHYTPSCEGLVSINGYVQSGNLVVEYIAPSDVPKIRITVNYPNGGQYVGNFVNDGNNITIGLPTGVNGDFTLQAQSVCDEISGFYSPMSNQVTITKNSNPAITQTSESNTGAGGTRTQIFTVGSPVSVGNRYVMTVFSHDTTVTANTGDTPSSIAIKLRDAINATTELQWNDHGSAPVTGTVGFKPVATASGVQLIVVLNYQNSFSANAYSS